MNKDLIVSNLSVNRLGFANEQEYQYSLTGWQGVVEKIKEISEKG